MSLTAADVGLTVGKLPSGPHNAITDVTGIAVGHRTIHRPPTIHTGVTAIVPRDIGPDAPIRANLFAGNGFGKLIGATQLAELGQLESPILLTATMSAFRAADALVGWLLDDPRFADVTTFNPVVGECNDGYLSHIRARPVREVDVRAALAAATDGPVAQGNVGAGTGTGALGFKAGIGSASRVIDVEGRSHVVGGLVQANFGGLLRIGGTTIAAPPPTPPDDGSCMIVIATDAPVDARQLGRIARRAVFGLGRVGASYSHGSGDYAIALTTSTEQPLPDHRLDPVFAATLDVVEEMVLNALLAATTVTGVAGRGLTALTDTPQWAEFLADRGDGRR